MLSNFTLNTRVYLPVGVPSGLENLTITQGITLQQVFLSVSPSVGSPAGSLITAQVKGLGVMSTGVTLLA